MHCLKLVGSTEEICKFNNEKQSMESKSGLIVSFLAILELIKLTLIDCAQANYLILILQIKIQ